MAKRKQGRYIGLEDGGEAGNPLMRGEDESEREGGEGLPKGKHGEAKQGDEYQKVRGKSLSQKKGGE